MTPEVGFTEDVNVRGLQDEVTVEAKCDTGAKRTSVDLDVAAAVGAGPVVGTRTFKSGVDRSKDLRPIVEVDIRVVEDGPFQTVAASIADRGHLSYDVLLGRDVLSGFKVDLTAE